MSRREQGFTLIEILVVITIIAALAGMVTLLIPIAQRAQKKATCQNNLKQMGDVLALMDSGGKLKRYSGAAFLLQVVNKVKDEDLEVFLCPGDDSADPTVMPETGSPEFIEMYRGMNLKEEIEDHWTSYAGPNWRDHPKSRAGRKALESRLWGCDKCKGGAAHHDGIVVLYDTTKVGFLELKELQGHDPDLGEIQVGPNSSDPRLRKMIYFPAQ